MPTDFFPLLLQGTTRSNRFDWLFVSHKAITGTPTLPASSTAFLSVQGSQTMINFGSVKVVKFGFVKIPGGYLPLITLMPVNCCNFFNAFQPFSRLLRIKISSGLYLQSRLI